LPVIKVVEVACFARFSFCAGLHGYEVPKVVLAYLREFRQSEPHGDIAAHVALLMVGRFKL